NHMEGHIVAALLSQKSKVKSQKHAPLETARARSVFPSLMGSEEYSLQPIQYPALALLISGGHTELVLMPNRGKYKMLGQTRDDAVGEAFDKVARMLGLAYPGGPEVSRLAEKAPEGQRLSVPLPRPMLKSDDFDFSFSGLKTSVLYAIKKFELLDDRDRELIAKDFEDSVTEVLVAKTLRAAKKYNVKEIILGGGVTANKKIRKTFEKEVADLPEKISTEEISSGKYLRPKLFIPDVHLSGDNGLMIGVAGLLRHKSKKDIKAQGTLHLAKPVTKTLAELRKKK
ncbi:O-sialoglycoprotein endopeptidase, partial [sediment metagenome]